MPVGGSIESISWRGREFAVAAEAEGQRKLGGKENSKEMNGNGTSRTIQVRVPWKLDGLSLSMDDANEDQEFIQDTVDRGGDETFTITKSDSGVYEAVGTVTGEVVGSLQNITMPLTFEGGGKLTKQ